jgi:hypothetical protein
MSVLKLLLLFKYINYDAGNQVSNAVIFDLISLESKPNIKGFYFSHLQLMVLNFNLMHNQLVDFILPSIEI